MPVVTESDAITGVFIVEPDRHGDERGLFVETYRREWFPQGREMIQANRADRQAGCVVGLHYHLHQADYWYVPYGLARIVLHDLRAGSPTDGATLALDLIVRPGASSASTTTSTRPTTGTCRTGWPASSCTTCAPAPPPTARRSPSI